LTEGSKGLGKETILPLSGGHEYDTIKLISTGDLWIDILNGSLSSILILSLSEHLPGDGFTGSWWAHDEDTMSNFEQLPKLNNLENKVGVCVKLSILDGFDNEAFESHVSGSWHINAWEEISQKTEEDIVIIGNNLWNVEISEGSEQNGRLGETWLSSLHDSCDDEHRLNSSETPIIMCSLGKQISAQEVKGGELFSKHFGGYETLSHQHVFANKLKIWDDHSNWSEQSFETLWQLGSTEITWVHGDESTASWIKRNLITLDGESLSSLSDGVCHRLELDGAHREHLWHKSVELIEASPRSGGSQSLEDLGHTLVIHLIGAVEYIACLTESSSEILG
jgi:hypothetical protein